MSETVTAIVKYKNVDVKSKVSELSDVGVTVLHTHSAINAMTVKVSKDKLEEMKKDPNVEYVEVTTPKDVSVLGFRSGVRLAVSPTSQTIPWGISKIRATDVQSGGNKGTGIKVEILDTGIDYNHEDLKDNYKGGYNFVSNNTNPFDDYGHGTHVAGTVGALDNGVGVIGVAPECYLYGVKVLDNNGSGSYDNIVAGIQWGIDNGMQIISMSFGGGSPSQALQDILNAAKNRGIVLVAAAGNSDGDGSQDTVGYPARYDSCIAVASTDSNDNRSSFSSCGQEVWVAAPGSSVLSTVPKGTCALCDASGYKTLNGTSMATPHVSGTVALMLKSNPNLNPDNVKTLLSTTSIDLGASGRDVFFGYGRIDAVNATGETPPPPAKLSSISIPSSASIQVNQTTTLTTTCKDDSNVVITCPSLTWTSDNPNIVSVSNGTLTGKSQGTAGVSCANADNSVKSNSCTVSVTAAPPVTRYSCSGAPTYQCVPNPNGQFPDLATCQTKCRPAPPVSKKFMVQQLGNMGVTIIVSPFGQYTSDEACIEACRILKSISQ